MNSDQFYKKHKKIFKNCYLECEEGWIPILDLLCTQLQWDVDKNEYPQVEASQVKEKFGTLRFYYHYKDGEFKRLGGKNNEKEFDSKCNTQYGMIHFTEVLSAHVCERCGSNDDAKLTKSVWLKTLCKKCMTKEFKGKNVKQS